ncbi:hypothetical protein D9M70_466110 [compost metagenome]
MEIPVFAVAVRSAHRVQLIILVSIVRACSAINDAAGSIMPGKPELIIGLYVIAIISTRIPAEINFVVL